jgi:hypothetical protein
VTRYEYVVSHFGYVEADDEADAEVKAIDSYELHASIVTVEVTRKEANAGH